MNARKKYTESGQSMVIIALGLVAFVAMLALVLDGANAYAAKRQAQNAADAGALAGATYMCKNKDQAGGITQATDYAINRNGASSADVVASLNAGTVVVTATVERNTFFAGVIGFSQLAPRAVAAAACRPPIGLGVLPVAWSCRANAGNLPGDDCVQKIFPDCSPSHNPYDLNCTYIVMDSVKVKGHGNCTPDPNNPGYCINQDIQCAQPIGTPPNCVPDPNDIAQGKISCDINGDCIDELFTGGSRAWLNLDGGGGGANDLKNWIQFGFSAPIPPHKWIPSENGVSTSIFQTAAQYIVGKDVVLPVFNNICKGIPNILADPETYADCTYGAIDDLSIVQGSGNTNYHVITFSAFHVTCVQTNKHSRTAEPGYPPGNTCLGHDAAVSIGAIDAQDKTMEGYFKKLDLGGYGGPGSWFDAGTFTVVLTK